MGEKCPICHVQVRPTDYFCYNCGRNLRTRPLLQSPEKVIILIVTTLLLPPFGIVLGIRYLREPDTGSKIAGILAILVTVILLSVLTIYTIDLMNTVNDQVNSQLQNLQGY